MTSLFVKIVYKQTKIRINFIIIRNQLSRYYNMMMILLKNYPKNLIVHLNNLTLNFPNRTSELCRESLV